jgi:hypothetical protein
MGLAHQCPRCHKTTDQTLDGNRNEVCSLGSLVVAAPLAEVVVSQDRRSVERANGGAWQVGTEYTETWS